ncbi:hypothetical protein [Brachybacterium paraconglomeratum]|uniref:hypothetical protein n=1 Tax=Brachybacterium paraconglomeratum TaxID=173362 RepID=UPI0021A30D18|nr:hypothetical protein [Brachybacterium paraconglomeratum]MCT1909544.1 hypothetical protein [Brachybacterium paraconglomeratum]
MEPTPYRSHHQLEERVREVTAGEPSHLEVSFPESPPDLTAVEIAAMLEVITYLHDLALSEEFPGLIVGEIPDFRHPRRSLRTIPEAALRIRSIQYGSPISVELIVPAAAAVSAFVPLLRQAGATVRTYLQERGETGREEIRQEAETGREEIRQEAETRREKIRQDAEVERERIRQGQQRQPAAPPAPKVPKSLLPTGSSRMPRSAGVGHGAMHPAPPPTAKERARAPQTLLAEITNATPPEE